MPCSGENQQDPISSPKATFISKTPMQLSYAVSLLGEVGPAQLVEADSPRFLGARFDAMDYRSQVIDGQSFRGFMEGH